MVGKRKGLNTLFYEFARVIDEAKPKVFIFENVKGLVNHVRAIQNDKTYL